MRNPMKRTFNAGGPTSKPKAFVRPKNCEEVCQVLEYALANHIRVSVLGGGHDPKGKLCNHVEIHFFRPSDT